MDLIIGGAYQGKLDYAKEKYSLIDNDICKCSEDGKIDFSARCIYNFEQYLLYCIKCGKSPVLDFRDDAIIIMNDVFCGVVPIDPEIRAWRELCGRTGGEITRKAKHVTRVFCGIPQELK